MSTSKAMKAFVQKGLPVLMAFAASAGVIGTAVTASIATPKAVKKIKDDSIQKHDGDANAYTKTEAVISAWKYYLPAFSIGASTVTCIFGMNILSRHQQAAIAGAYTLVSTSYKEYKDKLKELFGEETHNAVEDAIMKEKCKDVHITCPGFADCSTLDFDTAECEDPEVTRTFYDSFSKRYFESTISKVIEAEYHLNRNLMIGCGGVSLNDFYEFLGLDKTEYGDEIGWWISDELYWIDFNHRRTTLDDGMEIYVIDMVFEPRSEEEYESM